MSIKPRYKAGDRVIVRKDLTAWVEYDGIDAVPEMVRIKGQVANIQSYDEVSSKIAGTPIYHLEGNGGWSWTESMFLEYPRFGGEKEALIGISNSVFEMLENLSR